MPHTNSFALARIENEFFWGLLSPFMAPAMKKRTGVVRSTQNLLDLQETVKACPEDGDGLAIDLSSQTTFTSVEVDQATKGMSRVRVVSQFDLPALLAGLSDRNPEEYRVYTQTLVRYWMMRPRCFVLPSPKTQESCSRDLQGVTTSLQKVDGRLIWRDQESDALCIYYGLQNGCTYRSLNDVPAIQQAKRLLSQAPLTTFGKWYALSINSHEAIFEVLRIGFMSRRSVVVYHDNHLGRTWYIKEQNRYEGQILKHIEETYHHPSNCKEVLSNGVVVLTTPIPMGTKV